MILMKYFQSMQLIVVKIWIFNQYGYAVQVCMQYVAMEFKLCMHGIFIIVNITIRLKYQKYQGLSIEIEFNELSLKLSKFNSIKY